MVCLLSAHPLVLLELQRFLGTFRPRSAARLLKTTLTADLNRLSISPARVYVVDSLSIGPATEGLVAVIRSRWRDARVIVLAQEVGESHSFPLLHLGVKGLIRYEEVARQLVRAIRLVADGGFWIPRKVMSDYLEFLQSARRPPLSSGMIRTLSRREKEVLYLLLKNLSNKEISLALHISESTVKFHISNIFRRYGVQRRSDLIVQSVQESATIQ